MLFNIFFSFLFQEKLENLSYFLNDCIISGVFDFIAASIFFFQFLQHGKGMEFLTFFSCLFALNTICFIIVTLLKRQMLKAEKSEEIENIAKVDDDIEYFEMSPLRTRTNYMSERNYTYDFVFEEINEIYVEC